MLSDYTIRLPNLFHDSVKLKALINTLTVKLAEGNAILNYLLLQTIDAAEGVWLDEIGEIVGVPRIAEQRSDAEIFTYCSFADIPGVSALGFSDTIDPQGGYYVGLDENGNPYAPLDTPISDTDYRTLIRAKVLATYSDDTINGIYNWIYDSFGVTSYVYRSNPCEVAVELDSYIDFYERSLLVTYAPIAAGVRIWLKSWPPYVPPPPIVAQIEDDEV